MSEPNQDTRSVADNLSMLAGVRIARISTVPFFVLTQLKSQIESLAALGMEVVVVSSDGPELKSLRDLPVTRCVTIDMMRSISPWRDLIALFRLFRFFRRERVQIAHSTTPKAGLLTALAAFAARVPLRLHTYTGQPWVNMRGINRWLARSSDRLIGTLNTHCYADSPSQRQFLIDQRLVVSDRLSVIGAGSLAGVDTLRFNSERFTSHDRAMLRLSLCIAEAAPVILFLGRITADKGVRELLEAFDSLKVAGSNAHLVFVGQFDTESGVAGLVSRSDIEHLRDTHIVGYSDCPEAYLAIANILCLPSHREGFGTVVIEAAAMGVPTIGTDIYGLSDAVVQGETGLLVPPLDVNELTNALALLLDNSNLRSKMGESAKQRAKALFDARKVNKQVAEEYVLLLQGKR